MCTLGQQIGTLSKDYQQKLDDTSRQLYGVVKQAVGLTVYNI